jgi:hypothetical protein
MLIVYDLDSKRKPTQSKFILKEYYGYESGVYLHVTTTEGIWFYLIHETSQFL